MDITFDEIHADSKTIRSTSQSIPQNKNFNVEADRYFIDDIKEKHIKNEPRK